MSKEFAMSLDSIVRSNRRLSKALSEILQAWIAELGTRILPLVAASSFALGLFGFFLAISGNAFVSGLMVAGTAWGMEGFGFKSFDKTFQAFADDEPDWLKALMLIASSLYVAIGMSFLLFTDAHSSHQVLTAALFLITACNYAIIGWDSYVRRIEEKADKDKSDVIVDAIAQIDKELEIKRKRDDYRREKKLKDAETFQKLSESSGDEEKVSERPKKVYTHWRQVPTDDKKLVNDMSISQIVSEFGTSEKTAGNWKKYAARDLAGSNGHV